VTPTERWLEALWHVVRARLPDPPARVAELGCGSLGGVVPRLRAAGYDALGVDPDAPEGDGYVRVEFEQADLAGLDAVVASVSLHHVADPAVAVDRVAAALAPGGTAVVVEWDWERVDDETAAWGFERLTTDGEPGWLHRRREDWLDSGRPWSEYLAGWAQGHGIHPAGPLLALLDERFERTHLARGPYLFPNLRVSEDDERAAIDAGAIRATRVDWAGRLR
jgi:SAM-dependent methyltransferase